VTQIDRDHGRAVFWRPLTWPPGNPVACPRQGAHHRWHVPARRRRLSRHRGRDDDGCPRASRMPERQATL